MRFVIKKTLSFFILIYFPFTSLFSTDSDPGDFVIVDGTTTFETLPYIETFSQGVGQNFDKWVSAQWTSFGSATDDSYQNAQAYATNQTSTTINNTGSATRTTRVVAVRGFKTGGLY